jgi:hypothetical protein
VQDIKEVKKVREAWTPSWLAKDPLNPWQRSPIMVPTIERKKWKRKYIV